MIIIKYLCKQAIVNQLKSIFRYKRRGVDEEGNCANYVETEQILSFRQHQMSFTQIRGSVPVYWSQPGYKYRPPPRLDRGKFIYLFIIQKKI